MTVDKIEQQIERLASARSDSPKTLIEVAQSLRLLLNVAKAADAVIEHGDGSVIETNFQKLDKALAALKEAQDE